MPAKLAYDFGIHHATRDILLIELGSHLLLSKLSNSFDLGVALDYCAQYFQRLWGNCFKISIISSLSSMLWTDLRKIIN